MKYTIEKREGFTFVGISIRTTNEDRQSEIDIPKLWERFFNEDIKSLISNRINEEILAVYSDYEGDFMKPYTYSIGFKVSECDQLHSELMSKEIPAMKCAVITVEGVYPQSLMQAWQEIWNSDVHRSYRVDFECYPADFDLEKRSDLKIYLGIE